MDWTPPEVLRRFYPGGLFGHDKRGRPIWIEPIGLGDYKGKVVYVDFITTAEEVVCLCVCMSLCVHVQQTCKWTSIKFFGYMEWNRSYFDGDPDSFVDPGSFPGFFDISR